MAQSNIVRSFRQRLLVRGFRSVHIVQHGLFYHVSYVDPVCGQLFEYGVTLGRLENCLNKRYDKLARRNDQRFPRGE